MSRVRVALLAACSMVPAAAVGAGAAAQAGVSWRVFAPNVVAVVVGALAFAVVSSMARARVVRALAVVGLVAQAATFFAVGLDGVHRWLTVGGLTLQVSSMALPWWCALLLDEDPRWRTRARGLVVLVQLLHVLQPDAAQATTLAVVVAALRQPLWLLLLLVGGAAWTWGQPDPLLPVAHVEQIDELINQAGQQLWALAAAAALLGALYASSSSSSSSLLARGAALTLLTSWALTCAVGAFPCAIFGAGAAAVLGWWGWWLVAAAPLSPPTPPSSS